jgi:uncharacterized protein
MAGRIDTLIVKIFERCNLNCGYCYMYQHADQSWRQRPHEMDDEVFDQLLVRVKEYCERRAPHRMNLTLHGGEPTLVGPDRVQTLLARARETLGESLGDVAMQTNGILLNEKWIEVIRANGIRVGVSLDGPPEVHDAIRVDHAGRGSYAASVRGLRLLQDAGLSPGLLCVTNPASRGLDVYRHFRSLGVQRIDFLFPDISHDNKAEWYGRFGNTPVADYLVPVFDEWFADDNPRVRIRVFWGLIKAIIGGGGHGTDAFGNPLMGYLIVETDGSIHALDALRVCEDGVADSGLDIFSHGFDDLAHGIPLVHRLVNEGLPLSPTCQACHERSVCGGGYLPHRYSRANGFDNPSVWCADILTLVTHIRNSVACATATL